MPYTVSIRQVFLQEFNRATHLCVVLRTQNAREERALQIGRRGALYPYDVDFAAVGAFVALEFRVTAGDQVFAVQTVDSMLVTELFRCPADVAVAEAQELVARISYNSLHILACAPCEIEPSDAFMVYFRGLERVFAYFAAKLMISGRFAQLALDNAEYEEDPTIRLLFCRDGEQVELFSSDIGYHVIQAYTFDTPGAFAGIRGVASSGVIEQQFFCFSKTPVRLPKAFSNNPLELMRVRYNYEEFAFLAISKQIAYSNAVSATEQCDGELSVYANGYRFELTVTTPGTLELAGYGFEFGNQQAAYDIFDETISVASATPERSRIKRYRIIIEAPEPLTANLQQLEHYIRKLRIETQLTEQIRLRNACYHGYKATSNATELRTLTRGAKIERILLRLSNVFHQLEGYFAVRYNNVLIAQLLKRVRARGTGLSDDVLRLLGRVYYDSYDE